MIRAVIHDIGQIIDELQKFYAFDQIAYHLDANVKYYLHTAFLDDRIADFDVKISQGPDLIHLNVQVKEDVNDDWDYLGFAIHREDTKDAQKIVAEEAYKRAMRGI